MWSGFFRVLAKCAYARASSIVSLCEASRARQISDGAAPERTRVISNGIDTARFGAPVPETQHPAPRRPLRVGFVGRVVPIKDLITFIRACHLAMQDAEIEVHIFGPDDEDRSYARRCRNLVAKLGLGREIRFEASRPAARDSRSWRSRPAPRGSP
jgi:glycosyltransferase involved in cell wall biosynthesis